MFFLIQRAKLKTFIKYTTQKIYLYELLIKIHSLWVNKGDIWHSFIWYICNYILSNIPIHPLRVWGFRNLLKIDIGEGCFIHLGCMFVGNVSVGRNSVIGRRSTLIGNITIGNNVSITAECYIFSESHDKNSPEFSGTSKPVIIEDYVWMGARSLVLPGVVIGRGAILGAASAATKSIPPFTVFAGVPAKKVGTRANVLSYRLEYHPYFN